MTRITNNREYVNANPVRDDGFRREWARNRPYCYFCGTNYHVETHHILGGFKRSDEACNLVRLCAQCHRRVHNVEAPKITLADVLEAKARHDPHQVDLRRLRELNGKELPP